MKGIANLKDGGFYYIQNFSLVDECFVDALGGSHLFFTKKN